MILKRIFLFALCLVLLILVPIASGPTELPTPPDTLTMTNITRGNVLNGQVFVTPLGQGCYFPIIVNASITWNGNTTYRILTSNFVLTVFVSPNFIANTTNFITVSPNNSLQQFLVPANSTLIFQMSFTKICIIQGSIKVSLVYNDGLFNFRLVS